MGRKQAAEPRGKSAHAEPLPPTVRGGTEGPGEANAKHVHEKWKQKHMETPFAVSQEQGIKQKLSQLKTEAESPLDFKIDYHCPPNLQGILNCLDSIFFNFHCRLDLTPRGCYSKEYIKERLGPCTDRFHKQGIISLESNPKCSF